MSSWPRIIVAAATCAFLSAMACATESVAQRFKSDIEPLLEQYCHHCHGGGLSEGGVTLDAFSSDKALLDHDLWLRVLKNVRAGIMPPAGEDRPTDAEMAKLEDWIKHGAFEIDPQNPDPGHVTARRLNRNEYRQTIKALFDYDYDADENFPPDDTGHGFDNIGDLLSTSPVLVEKYMQAADEIVRAVVPSSPTMMQEQLIYGKEFTKGVKGEGNKAGPGTYSRSIQITAPGEYRIVVEFGLYGRFDAGEAKSRIRFECDGEELFQNVYDWQDERAEPISLSVSRTFEPGEKQLSLHFTQHAPPEEGEKAKAFPVTLRIANVRVQGPLDKASWVRRPGYEKFFLKPEPPAGAEDRRAYAKEVLRPFISRAFRRPVDEPTLDRLVSLAESSWSAPGATFEEGVQQAMIAALCSRRFLYRVEESAPLEPGQKYPFIDEYSLASRLSYFLWCSMPDTELFDLAAKGELRKNLQAQIARMLVDPKSRNFVESFVGQWLRTREVDTVEIDARLVMARDMGEEAAELAWREDLSRRVQAAAAGNPDKSKPKTPPAGLKNISLDPEFRTAMRQETELCFAHILDENRSVLELIDADYTFLNERLAKHYGIDGVAGEEMRKVSLSPESQRGGILTHAGLLMITSQSTRTSAVKRGLFVLDGLLGTPAPPPPPNIPSLEVAEKTFEGREPTLRESLELHRANALCASCHNRMDPLGLALENFNALGLWRTEERKQPIVVEGELSTGEKLAGAADLRKILVENRKIDYYRCLTEKMLIFAIGRGLEYYDTEAQDRIVERLEQDNGKLKTLVMAVIESDPFQKCRK